jgi:hypothetical protein
VITAIARHQLCCLSPIMGMIMPPNPWIDADTFRHFRRVEPGSKMSVDGTLKPKSLHVGP